MKKHNRSHQRSIRVEGAGDAVRDYYVNVIKFLKQELKIPNNISVFVHLNFKEPDMSQNGSTVPDEKNKSLVHIYTKPRLDKATLLRALCHEMVHVEQIASGRLKVDIKDGTVTSMVWNNTNVTDLPYSKGSEWELEAQIKEKQLLPQVIQSIGNLMI